MKHIQSFVSAAVCIAVLAFAATASAQTITQGIVTVVRIQGAARYSSGDNVWHPLSAGKTLGENDVIQTAANSTVDLVLGDKAVRVNLGAGAGSPIGGAINIAGLPVTPMHIGGQSAPQQNVVRLEADSMLSIDKFTYSQTGADIVTDTELNLSKGKAFANVKKVSAASEFIVKTPVGVSGIRGSSVWFGADGSCTVTDGSCVISEIVNGQPITITLTAGQSYDPDTQQVSNLTPEQQLTAEETATKIVFTINATVTAVYAAAAPITPSVYISPTSGNYLSVTITKS
jgi:hypothetical protein